MANGKVLLVAAHSIIEPLGLLHLGGLAKELGWERKFHLTKNHNFTPLFEKIKTYKPDVIGFNIYTGNHIQVFEAIDIIKKSNPSIEIVIGGPHATYFPLDGSKHADYVVMSEGFKSFRKILLGEADKGIAPLSETEPFPFPDRELLYIEYPEYGNSRIKSIIGMTGCPYRCTYCYNSSSPDDINATPEMIKFIAMKLGMSGRLFPYNVREVDEIIEEAEYMTKKWPTQIIYFQDDVHGVDTKKWLPELAKKWKSKVGIPYHASMRWEMIVGKRGEERLDLIKKAGCHGLTLAIEAADIDIRKEVLDRGTVQEDMYEGMSNVINRGFKVRTEQITGLPYGATTNLTPINLDADLSLVELNVDLKKKTGGPTMAWASTFAPYSGTKLGLYSNRFGHYKSLANHDVPDTFFKRSILRFPKKWEGVELENKKDDSSTWLEEESLEKYRTQNAILRGYFNVLCLIPDGHIIAKEFLTLNDDYSPKSLGKYIIKHLKKHKSKEAKKMLFSISLLENGLYNRDIKNLLPYFGCVPKPELLIKRYIEYISSQEGDDDIYILSTATRHHLYEEILYAN